MRSTRMPQVRRCWPALGRVTWPSCSSGPGLHGVEPTALTIQLGFRTFQDWWEPFTLGVGPAGAYVAGLDSTHRAALAAECAKLLPEAPFEVSASAWTVLGRA